MTAEQIRNYRESKGLTQSQFASLLRVSPTAVTQWEKGQVPSGPASLLLEHLIEGTPLFSAAGDADWDMPLTLKEWEELERRRVRTGFLTVRDYMIWLVRQDMLKEAATREAETSTSRSSSDAPASAPADLNLSAEPPTKRRRGRPSTPRGSGEPPEPGASPDEAGAGA
ncbi:Helix-turn-helix [Prosthecobacter debontii]|uniref:Helix-turn-helix n=1 Tax=Prosthecobacter debontii TaxID=48467 RepID=A0A1T4Y0C8_9BACT|nr:helix-turn-helix domain-containing protein [Prosthecobacter debontii]SKA94751.1 Helix-turn-helix [Prosthecobacter debontii]